MIRKRLIRCAVSTGFWALILLAGMSSFATAQTPLAEWKFNEGSGNEAFDSFGQGYAARLSNGVRWVASKGGWAVSADADSRGTVSIPPIDLSSTRTVTLAFWVKRNYATDDGGVLLESGRDTLLRCRSLEWRRKRRTRLMRNRPYPAGIALKVPDWQTVSPALTTLLTVGCRTKFDCSPWL